MHPQLLFPSLSIVWLSKSNDASSFSQGLAREDLTALILLYLQGLVLVLELGLEPEGEAEEEVELSAPEVARVLAVWAQGQVVQEV